MTHSATGPLIALAFACAVIVGATVVPARSECLHSGITSSGMKVCMQDDLVGRNIAIPERSDSAVPTFTVIGPPPKCENGWTLVVDMSMNPMCVRDLRKPQ